MNDRLNKGDIGRISEAVTRSQVVVPYLTELGYRYIDTDVLIHRDPQTGANRRIRVDIVVYLDGQRTQPYIVVEIKKLTDEVTLLHPSVQQLFHTASILGDTVRYLLVTDGQTFYWLERSLTEGSLTPLSSPPKIPFEDKSVFEPVSSSLVNVVNPEQFTALVQSILEAWRVDGANFGLHTATDLNRVIIAKLFDEQRIAEREPSRFKSGNDDPEDIAGEVKQLYLEAINNTMGQSTRIPQTWVASPNMLVTAVKILEPYALSSVSVSIRGQFFWQTFLGIINESEWSYVTPQIGARFMAQLAKPLSREKIIDPACGTGLLLVELSRQVDGISVSEAVTLEHSSQSIVLQPAWHGIELNADIAQLAETNLVLNEISPKQLIVANALDRAELVQSGVEMGTFDLVISDLPTGIAPIAKNLTGQFKLSPNTGRVHLEGLFIEQSVHLLKPGGRFVLLVPDLVLSSPSRLYIRQWLLRYTQIEAIVSLPPEAFPTGTARRKSTIILLRKPFEYEPHQDFVTIADVRAIGLDRFGQLTLENDLPELLKLIQSMDGKDIKQVTVGAGKSKIWSVPGKALTPERLDVAWLDPSGFDPFLALGSGRYPIVRLKEVVKIIRGQRFKGYVAHGRNTAAVVNTPVIRELELDLSKLRYVPIEEYRAAKQGFIELDDVLVTTAGQHIGQAAVITSRPNNFMIASGGVTILRRISSTEIDPLFIAALIVSNYGKQQLARLQTSGTTQPSIRRSDLGELLIPLPPLNRQRELAERIRTMLMEAKRLLKQAREIEEAAKTLVLSELMESMDDE